MSDERRIAQRVDTQPGTIMVQDRINDVNLGTIANISSTGFMLVTDQYIDTDSVFQFSLDYGDAEPAIEIGAICLWTTEASSATSFWSGFHIIDISDTTQANLDVLVKRMSA